MDQISGKRNFSSVTTSPFRPKRSNQRFRSGMAGDILEIGKAQKDSSGEKGKIRRPIALLPDEIWAPAWCPCTLRMALGAKGVPTAK